MGIAEPSDTLVNDVLREYGIESFGELDPGEQELLRLWAEDNAASGRSDIVDRLWEHDFHEKPVTPEVFFTDEDYLGNIKFYDACLRDMLYVLDPKNGIDEHILTGSVGWGKSTVAVALNIFKLYFQLCLKNPALYYDAQQVTTLVTMFFGIDLNRASLSLWSKMTGFLGESAWFRDKGFVEERTRDGGNSEIRIKFRQTDDVQVVAASRPGHALSLDVVGGILDEMEFRATKSVKDVYASGSQAYDLYRDVHMRQANRFPQRKPGILCVISSAGSKFGFMSSHIESFRDAENVFISDYAAYKVAAFKYSGKQFPVEIGDDTHNSRILVHASDARAGARVEMVPEEHRVDFERNVEESLMDVAGISSYGSSKLIQDRISLGDCIDEARSHPFTKEVISVGINTTSYALQDFLDVPALVSTNRNKATGKRMPRKNPFVSRYIHVDLAKSQDACGIVMGHCDGWKEQTRADENSGKVNMHHPRIFLDFSLQVEPAVGDVIDFAVILNFLFFLRDTLGYRIKKFSTDQYQSEQLRQAFTKRGVKSEVYSVDRTDLAYVAMRDAYYYRCINMYHYEPLMKNLGNLEHDLELRKVDHAVNGSKDVSDCVAAVTRHIIVDYPIRFDSLGGGMVSKAGEVIDLIKSRPKKEAWRDSSWVKGDHKQSLRDPGDFFTRKKK